MTTDTIIRQETDIYNGSIGKRYLFWNRYHPDDQVFTFSSSIENIGIDHDRALKNKTIVLVLSEPEQAYHPKVGNLMVVKAMADKSMWLPTECLEEILEN